MSDVPTNGTQWRINDLDSRVKKLESAEVAVLAERVRYLAADFAALKHAFYGFAFSVVAGCVLFAFTVLK